MFGFKKKNKSKEIILLVEDDALLQEVLKTKMEKDGYVVVTTADGLEVLDLAKKHSPNLIVLDLIIPGIDGFTVLKQLKEDDTLSKIPVVVLSNLDKEDDVKSTIALGAREHIVKASTKIEDVMKAIKRNVQLK